MDTSYTVFRVGCAPEKVSAFLPPEPGYDALKGIIEPLINGEPLEHVSVLHEGHRRDMFVSEIGALALTTRDPLPVNREATAIYRNNWLTQHPGTDPDDLPAIHGTAVLFDRRVWF